MAHLFSYEGRDFCHIHIPKMAGKSIIYDLVHNGNLDIDGHNDGSRILGHTSLSDIAGDIGDPRDYTIISIIRNPFSWYVSWYNFIKNEIRSDPDFVRERQIVDNETFSTFIIWVAENRENLVFANRGFETPKFQEYIDWHGGEELCDLVNVIKMEEIYPDILKDRFGLNIKFGSIIGPARKKTNWRDWYDESTKAIVADMHARDLEKYGYEFG